MLLATPAADAQKVRFLDADPEGVGLVLPREAGLPDQLWLGGSPERLGAAIAAIPAEVRSPAQHRALVRLLRVSAAPPTGEAATPSLASLRLAALARLGAEQDVLDLADRIVPDLRQTPYWDARVHVALLRYNLAEACALPAEAGDAAATADWQRLAGFCRLLRGQEEAAMVAVMLADELADPQNRDDAVFADLFLAKQFSDRPAGPAVIPTEPLQLTMLRALNRPMAVPKAWADVPAAVASGVARYPGAGLEPRTAAAERSVAANLLPAGLLVQLYLATELTTPLGTAYRQMAYIQGGAGAEAAAEAFWDAASKAGLYMQLAPFSTAFAPARRNAPTLLPAYAGRALRTALIADDVAAIGAWRDVLAAASPTVAGTATRNAAYAVLALAGEPVPPPEVWWPDWQKAAKPNKADQELVAGLLQALGQPVPNAIGPKADRSKTAQAITGAPLGEATVLALTALATAEKPSPGLQVLVVETLARLSPTDARAIALELAVGSGI